MHENHDKCINFPEKKVKWIRNWLERRRAVNEARKILNSCHEGKLFSQTQQEDLLALRKFFWREKMGSWLERLTLYRMAASLKPDATLVEIGSWVGVSTCYIGCGLRSGGGGGYCGRRYLSWFDRRRAGI